MTHSRGAALAGALTLSLFLAHSAWAGPSVMGPQESTVKQASEKLWRGLVNAVTGIGELIRQPVVCTQEGGAAGIPVGIINGVFMSVVRTSAGLLEVATFPVALDSTTGFRSIMNPVYVWEPAIP